MAAKRIGREPSPTDLGFKLIAEAAASLAGLRDLADTDEFRTIANAIASVNVYDAEPTFNLGSKRWEFSSYQSGLQSWDELKLVTLLVALKGLDPDEEGLKEYPDSNNKDWEFTWKFEGDFSIRVQIMAYLSSTAPGACRRIQIGTKMVEQPIYRNECAPDFTDVSGALPAPVLNLEVL